MLCCSLVQMHNYTIVIVAGIDWTYPLNSHLKWKIEAVLSFMVHLYRLHNAVRHS